MIGYPSSRRWLSERVLVCVRAQITFPVLFYIKDEYPIVTNTKHSPPSLPNIITHIFMWSPSSYINSLLNRWLLSPPILSSSHFNWRFMQHHFVCTHCYRFWQPLHLSFLTKSASNKLPLNDKSTTFGGEKKKLYKINYLKSNKSWPENKWFSLQNTKQHSIQKVPFVYSFSINFPHTAILC
jgi:hypothetical protein